MSKKFLILVGVVIVFFLAGYFGYQWKQETGVFGKATSEFAKYATDVVGTRVATTTTGVGFRITSTGGISATTTYISRISGDKTNALYMITPVKASSTALTQFDFFGSNDDFCEATATSTTDAACVGDCVLTSDINWYSAGDHLQNRTHLVNLLNDSSTAFLSWTNPTSTPAGVEVLLTNLNYECLRMDVSGSSTLLYASIRTK